MSKQSEIIRPMHMKNCATKQRSHLLPQCFFWNTLSNWKTSITLLVIVVMISAFSSAKAAEQERQSNQTTPGFSRNTISASVPMASQKDDKVTNPACDLFFGENHLFEVVTPVGWVRDNKSALSQGLHCALYLKGSSWANSKSVMYTVVVPRMNQTLQQVIDMDVAYMGQGASQFKSSKVTPIVTEAGRKAEVWYFSGDEFDSYEAVAYFEEKKSIILIVLSTRSKTDFESSLPDFAALAKSYRFSSEKVYTERENLNAK
jgi:hypothetical protein